MTITSGTQLKDVIRNLARKNSSDAQILLRTYMTERFLERLSISDYKILKLALSATAAKRGTAKLMINAEIVLDALSNDSGMMNLWKRYQKNYNYARELSWSKVTNSARSLYLKIK